MEFIVAPDTGIKTYNVMADRQLMESLIDKLFGKIDEKNIILDSIKDRLLEDYLKLVVVDNAYKQNLIVDEDVIKINIITDVDTVVCMATYNKVLKSLIF